MDMNLVILAGKVDREPTLDTLPSGNTMAIMDIKVCRSTGSSDLITVAIHNPDPDHQMFKPNVVGKQVWVAGYIKVLCNEGFADNGDSHEHINAIVAEDLEIADEEESDEEESDGETT